MTPVDALTGTLAWSCADSPAVRRLGPVDVEALAPIDLEALGYVSGGRMLRALIMRARAGQLLAADDVSDILNAVGWPHAPARTDAIGMAVASVVGRIEAATRVRLADELATSTSTARRADLLRRLADLDPVPA